MHAAIKFCGLTRAEDASAAVALGADYLGVIFAPSPRRVTVALAQTILAAAENGRRPSRVGVFAHMTIAEISDIATALSLDVIQLHHAVGAGDVAAIRDATNCRIWSVVPVGVDGVPLDAMQAARDVDAVLFDSKVDGKVGGTGRVFDWRAARDAVAPLRGTRPVILAGGLHPANVAEAIATFRPDVVDVSSGVESSPGIKDHARMRAFADAVRGVPEE